MYGKIENGIFTIAPKQIKKTNKIIFNPTDEMLSEFGYKELITEPMPVEQGYYYTPIYTETETHINQSWEQHVREDDEITQLQLAIAELAELVIMGV